MEIVGKIDKEKQVFLIDNKKIKINNYFVFIKGTIFNLIEICQKYKLNNNLKIEEIIEELYQNIGLNSFKELDGNYVIVIYDKKENTLHLIKDKLGSIFVYYYHYKDKFVFSTSLRLLLNTNAFKKVINKQALANFLGYMYIYEPLTIYENTYKLEKATILTYKDQKVNKLKYFDLYKEYKFSSKDRGVSENNLIKEFNELFNKSIEKLGEKSSQVGVFMSSGEDSTLIAKLASNIYDKKINTYTLGFENERDESVQAKKIAKYIGSNHHSIILRNKDVLSTIQKIPEIYEEPFADPSIIPNIYMTENIKDKNDFYLTGEGNDAIFVASSMYHIYNFYPRIKLIIKKFINILNKKRVYHGFSEMAQINVINRFNYSDRLLGVKGKVYDLQKVGDKKRSAVIGDLNNTVSEKYKVKTASLANYHNYKYFTPFYEPDVILKTFRIPTKYLYKNGQGKYIFKKILHENIPASYFANYKKNGFGIPLVLWMQEMMLPEIKKLSLENKIKKQKLFDYKELTNLIDGFEKNPDYNKAVVLWCYYVFQLWYQYNM